MRIRENVLKIWRNKTSNDIYYRETFGIDAWKECKYKEECDEKRKEEKLKANHPFVNYLIRVIFELSSLRKE